MIDPQLGQFLKDWGEKWSGLKPDATAVQRRKWFEAITHRMRMPTPVDVEPQDEHWIESVSGPVRVRIFRHKSAGLQPCLIYMHGGGWTQGSPETHWDITSLLSSWNQQTVVSIDYALTPEEPFPTAINQCTAVAGWAHSNADALKIDKKRIAVGGDSAGGNLAAAITLDLLGTEVALAAQVLFYPACDFDRSRPSYVANPNAPMIRTDGQVEKMYCPDPEDRKNPRSAPLLADSHAGLPPAYIAVAEHDPLRDSGLAYAIALENAGVPVLTSMGEGLTHGYLRALDCCDASMKSLRDVASWLDNIYKSADGQR